MCKINKVNINNKLSLQEQLSKRYETKTNYNFTNQIDSTEFSESTEQYFLEDQRNTKNDDDEIAKIREMNGELQENGSYKVIYKKAKYLGDEEISYIFNNDGTIYIDT